MVDVGEVATEPTGVPLHGLGLTRRLFKALLDSPSAVLPALGATYVPIIRGYVQSVAPSKQVMAQLWCPVIVECDDGRRRVLHVDPLAVRQYRRTVAGELREVQDKRRRMLKRIQDIRGALPPTGPREQAARLGRELALAEARIAEPLVHTLPREARVLHVLVEVSPEMTQLDLVCQRLAEELPDVLAAADVQYITFTPLSTLKKSAGLGDVVPAALEEPIQVNAADSWAVAQAWLEQLANAKTSLTARRAKEGGLRVAPALRRLATADSLGPGGGSLLLVACSPPADADAAVELLRRSEMVLQVAGVFGASEEDPESELERLADAAAEGSHFRLFFGPEYWMRYAAIQRGRFEQLAEKLPVGSGDHATDDDPLVEPTVFELRLIERVMRECYVEEQRCEEELVCAGHLLARTLVPPEDVQEAMRGQPAIPTAGKIDTG